MSSSSSIPDSLSGLPQAVKIVRQHAHDVRNHLNGLELSATLMEELAGDDADISATLSQIRRNLAQVDDSLKSLVRQFSELRTGFIPAAALLQSWRERLTPLLTPGSPVDWEIPTGSAPLMPAADAEKALPLLTALALAAHRRSGGQAFKIRSLPGPGLPAVEIREPLQGQPFPADVLEGIRQLAESRGAELEHGPHAGTGEWVTRLSFPAAPEVAPE